MLIKIKTNIRHHSLLNIRDLIVGKKLFFFSSAGVNKGVMLYVTSDKIEISSVVCFHIDIDEFECK